MMVEYKGIENDAPNAIANTATPGGQELELWSPAGEITHQRRVESEGNQLENAGALRTTIKKAAGGKFDDIFFSSRVIWHNL